MSQLYNMYTHIIITRHERIVFQDASRVGHNMLAPIKCNICCLSLINKRIKRNSALGGVLDDNYGDDCDEGSMMLRPTQGIFSEDAVGKILH